jgi:hypothetical protein
VQGTIGHFARALRTGGRLFVQVLNFPPMRAESPCMRGPRAVTHDGIEYVSTRLFRFDDQGVEVTNVTMWRQGEWRSHAHSGRLYPVTPDELERWCLAAGLRIDERWGGYAREPFNATSSVDYILVATRVRIGSGALPAEICRASTPGRGSECDGSAAKAPDPVFVTD